MQDYLVLSCGVNSFVDSMETLVFRRLALQVDVSCKPPKRPVHGDGTLWLQGAAQHDHLWRRQCLSGAKTDSTLPVVQRVEPDPAHVLFGKPLHFPGFLC